MSQQEIIDLAIASYLKSNDNTAKQYLKLRQDALAVTTQIQKELEETGQASPESQLKLENLKFENAKMSLTYKAYIERITRNLDLDNDQISAKLDKKFDDILAKKLDRDEKIDQLRKEHKPVVEKMRLLASTFESAFALRFKRSGLTAKIFTSRDSEADENSVSLDFGSSVFTKAELEDLLKDVEQKLSTLKTVDAIDEGTSETTTAPENCPSISLKKYIDELLQTGRGYSRVGDLGYHIDITRSASVESGKARETISDYEYAIDLLTKEIQNLVARGADAKERWVKNAIKIESIQAMLQEDMDIDG